MILGGTIIDCEHLKMVPVILIYERVATKKKRDYVAFVQLLVRGLSACVEWGRLLNTLVKSHKRLLYREH